MKTLITNEKLYNKLVVEVDLENVKNVTNNSFEANVEIEFTNGDKKEFQGEFGYNDFRDQFGFKFLNQ